MFSLLVFLPDIDAAFRSKLVSAERLRNSRWFTYFLLYDMDLVMSMSISLYTPLFDFTLQLHTYWRILMVIW